MSSVGSQQQKVSAAYTRRAGHELARLLSADDFGPQGHGIALVQNMGNSQRSYLERHFQKNIAAPWDQLCIEHAIVCACLRDGERAYKAAFETQNKLATEFLRWFQASGQRWVLPVLYQVCRDMRHLAEQADEYLARKGIKTFALEEAARFLNKAFTACLADRINTYDDSRRWGTYYVVGLVFKTYFKVDRIPLCRNINRAIQATKDLAPLSAFPKSHQVTYRYYNGVLAFLDEKFEKAEEDLNFASDHCHRSSHRNMELILTYLIPLRLLRGTLPSRALLERFPRLSTLYDPFVDALKRGNVKAYDEALVHGERPLAESGTYGVVERGREICLRGLFRKVWEFNGQEKIVPVSLFRAALRTGGVDIETEEVECLLAGMIFKGYMKGYIAQPQQKVVMPDFKLGKSHPFPPVGQVRPAVAIPF